MPGTRKRPATISSHSWGIWQLPSRKSWNWLLVSKKASFCLREEKNPSKPVLDRGLCVGKGVCFLLRVLQWIFLGVARATGGLRSALAATWSPGSALWFSLIVCFAKSDQCRADPSRSVPELIRFHDPSMVLEDWFPHFHGGRGKFPLQSVVSQSTWQCPFSVAKISWTSFPH